MEKTLEDLMQAFVMAMQAEENAYADVCAIDVNDSGLEAARQKCSKASNRRCEAAAALCDELDRWT